MSVVALQTPCGVASDSRIARLEAENDQLRALVTELKSLAFGEWRPPAEWLLTPSQQRIFALLLKRGQVTREQAASALWALRPEGEIPDRKVIDVQLCHMRKKLAPFGVQIRTLWGQGIALDPETRTRLRGEAQSSALGGKP